MVEITEALRERFANDTGLPIKMYEEPYFSHLLELYDEQFDAKSKYAEFLELLTHFETEQDYFTEYNRIKEDAIQFLKSNEAMQRFCNDDPAKTKLVNIGYPGKTVFKETNVGKHLVSIDMKKANFTALRHYDPAILGYKETYEDFLGMFTIHDYFKKSKYIRQVIFGNQIPKRQTAYEQHLMDMLLTAIFQRTGIASDKVEYFGADEIVLDVSEYVQNGVLNSDFDVNLEATLNEARANGVNVRKEYYKLYRIRGTKGYMKVFEFGNEKAIEFKSVDHIRMPLVMRAYRGETPTEEDMVFYHDDMKVKLLNHLKIEFSDIPQTGAKG